jgi:hypothetical protein
MNDYEFDLRTGPIGEKTMKVWPVYLENPPWDHQGYSIDSLWDTEDAAKEQVEKLKKLHTDINGRQKRYAYTDGCMIVQKKS